MRTLYLGFSKAKSKWAIFSKLIMWVQAIPFSHVYIKFNSDFIERDFIYQASGTKVNFENIQSFDSHSLVIKEFKLEVSSEIYKKVLQFTIDNVGKPYSLKQVFGIAWICFKQRLGLKSSNPFKDSTASFVCSEIGADILEITGKSVPEDKDSLGPKEVFNRLNKEV
jgi:hypothetical protein